MIRRSHLPNDYLTQTEGVEIDKNNEQKQRAYHN
jgi:hypothetical protein